MAHLAAASPLYGPPGCVYLEVDDTDVHVDKGSPCYSMSQEGNGGDLQAHYGGESPSIE